MAQQSIVNVDSQVEQSVVDSTTGVDVSKTVSSVTTSGGKLEESHAEITAQDVEVVKSQNGDIEAGGNSILDSNRSADYARTNTPGVGESVESDGDVGSGSGSPSKGLASDANAKTTTRPTSVKKIQSFKAVSINRQYLEKASSSGPVATVPKTVFSTDRSSSFVTQATSGGSSTLSFAKPRLVAKSTSGLRDSSPGTGLGTISTGSAKNAVEAQRAVWNKNQPPPVIPQKEMSDEELQKNYGIHLASRLQSDDTNKETKWADEDDDDDWVPEAIEWNDGTKVALQPEPSTAKSTEKEPSGKTEEKPSEPKTLVFTRDPGKIAGSGDKGVPKDAPQPRSSPWAPVPQPNVVPIKPPSESRSSDYGSQHQGSSREAHSDEFNRSWRDRPMNSRELFNSETGQLEPVQDRRNRALRNSRGELQSIKTQVLQRPPSQLSGPEPSPAFQQNRSGSYRQDDYRRRRTSSNVSGGSGSTGRRLSFNKGMHGLDHPLTPEDSSFSPRNVLQESVHPPQQSQGGGIDPLTPQSATVPAAAPVIVEEDPIAMQQRVMKEARELARKRKQEEEEREEAAKKERLRLKLAELEAKAAKAVAEKEAAEKAAAEKAAAEAAAAEAAAAEREAEAARAVAAEKDAAARAADEAALQAGAADIQAQGGSAADTTSTTMTVTQQPSAMAPATLPSPNPQQYAGPSPTAPYRPGSYGARSPTKSFSSLAAERPRSPLRTYVAPAHRDSKDQAWKGSYSANDRYTSWGHQSTKPHPSSSRASPWGPVGDKSRYPALDGVRNGTFEPSHEPSQYSHYGRQENTGSTHLSALGHPSQSDRLLDSSDRHSAPSPHAPLSTSPSGSRSQEVNPWASYPERLQREEAEEKRLSRQRETSGPIETPSPVKILETWRKVELDGSGARRVVEEVTYTEPHQASIQTQPNALPGGQANLSGHPPPHRLPPHHDNFASQQIPTGPSSTRHTSRFFPAVTYSSNQDAAAPMPPPAESPLPRLRSPASPPPPTCPVNDIHGDHPIPSVRLPPPPPNTSGASTVSRSNGFHKSDIPRSPKLSGVDAFEAVQMTIQEMIQKQKEQQQSSPSRTFASPVRNRESSNASSIAPSTKPVYDDARLQHINRSTTVTLPPNSGDMQAENAGDTAIEDACTKPNEEALLAELYVQDFGSQPTIKLPNIAHHTPFIPASLPPPTSKGKHSPKSKLMVVSIPMFDHFTNRDFTKDGIRFIPVRLPSAAETKEIPCNFAVAQPKPKKSSFNSNRKPRGATNSYNAREPHLGGYTNTRNSFRTGLGRAMADPVQ